MGQFEKLEADWAAATQEFLCSAEGKDWVRDPDEMTRLSKTLQAAGLVEAKNKVAALKACWALMKLRDQ
jgi:hypothetical protein